MRQGWEYLSKNLNQIPKGNQSGHAWLKLYLTPKRYHSRTHRQICHPLMHQSVQAVPIPQVLLGPFFLIVCPGGQASVYPRAFDGLSQGGGGEDEHCWKI